MEFLERIREIAGRLDPELFVKSRGGMYLLGAYPSVDAKDPSRTPFTTQPTIKVKKVDNEIETVETRPPSGQFLRKIEKSDRNPWQGRISVGRAPNSDVIIRHPSVSKLHAHFLTEAEGQEPAEQPPHLQFLALMDARSKNGTFVNSKPVPIGASVTVRSGDTVVFGEVDCVVLDAAALQRHLRAQAPLKK